MSDSYLLRRDVQRAWAWFAVGLIVLATALAVFVSPRASRRDDAGQHGPAVQPQSDTRPMPPPSVARTRALAV